MANRSRTLPPLNRETVVFGLQQAIGLLKLDLRRITEDERRFKRWTFDDSVPLPIDAHRYLVNTNPRLEDLRATYAELDLPVVEHSQWNPAFVQHQVAKRMHFFRAQNAFTWLYRNDLRVTELMYFIYAQYVRDVDSRGLLDLLDEDGLFGAWTFDFVTHGRVSRDLLDSVNELAFLDRHFGIFDRPGLTVLDIGAGYGRLAYRAVGALPNLSRYWCVDAIAESTFLSEYYLAFRGCQDKTTVVSLDRFPTTLRNERPDLAVNIHSFPECRFDAINWWINQIRRLEVPWLLIVPNDRDRLVSIEPDGTRRDYSDVLARAGYRLQVSEPVYTDPGVRQMMGLDDHFMLFELIT